MLNCAKIPWNRKLCHGLSGPDYLDIIRSSTAANRAGDVFCPDRFMKDNELKNAAWFRVKTHCHISGLLVSNPEVLTDRSGGGDYSLELAMLGSRIILIRASGYATAGNMVGALSFVDDYLARNVPAGTGLVFVEDYSLVAGADSEARKMYFEYMKNSGMFRGAVLHNLSPLFKISFKLAKRLRIYDQHAYVADTYPQAVTKALQILEIESHPQGGDDNTGISGAGRTVAPNGSASTRHRGGISGRFILRTKALLWGGYNVVNRGLLEKYADELLKHIEAIDWQADGRLPNRAGLRPGHPFRKVYEALGFIKSEIDRLWAERLKAEESLRESEARYRHLVEYAKAGILEIDFVSQRMISVNEAMVAASGYSREEILSMSYLDLLPEASREIFNKRLELILEGESIEENLECQILTKQGDLRWMMLNSHFLSENGRATRATVVATDITQLKETESRLLDFQGRLRGLSTELSMSEEKQRRLLASQLHDRVSQELAVANILLNSFERTIDEPGHLSQLQDIRKQIVKIINETRSLTFDLSPPVLYDLGLVEAVEWLAETIEETHHLKVEMRHIGVTKAIDDEIKIILFRNIKELMHNAVKHAQATRIFVELYGETDGLRVEVSDDGVGFDVERLMGGGQACQGFGLFNIKEKLNHLGGALEVRSVQGSETSITMTVPLGQPPRVGGGEVS